jgi:hypothetical protein
VLGLNPNPDDPKQLYFYRRFWDAQKRGESSIGDDGHFDSRFKDPKHPNRFVREETGLLDTITGRKIRLVR